MATPFATPDDVATLLDVTFTQGQTARCVMVLAGVSGIIRSRLPDIDTWIADGLTDPDLVKFCAVELTTDRIQVVEAGNKRAETHPEYAVVFRDGLPSPELLTAHWIELLTPSDDRAQSGRPFSIRPG